MGYLGTHTFGQDAGGHFAANGGFGGTGLPAPVGADLQQATTVKDVRGAQHSVSNSMDAQRDLLAALQKQGGLQSQSALSNQLAAANGVGTQNNAIAGLQGTAGMYQNIANGTGPNPAMSMLNQQTGQNVANQAALMAGQRGASANVGLIARQAAQQGAAAQQQAVGQGATMQAQQQVNALSGLTAAQQAMGGLGTSQATMQAAQANQMAGQQINQANSNVQSNLANQQGMQQALAGMNQANISNQGNVLAANTSLQNSYIASQQEGLKQTAKSMGGMSNAGGAAMAGAEGGDVMMAGGGNIYAEANPYIAAGPPPVAGPQSSFGQYLSRPQGSTDDSSGPDYSKNWSGKKPAQKTGAGGSDAWAGEDAGAGGEMPMAAQGGLAQSGGHVDAKSVSQRAVAKGDNYSNDKIPAKLSEGEIVLPRSVTMSNNPVNDAARFVQQVLAKRKVRK